MSETNVYYTVRTGGPTLCGNVAIFASKHLAEEYAKIMNMQYAFSETAVKDAFGISKAYLMGDGLHQVIMIRVREVEDDFLSAIFEWD